MFLPSGFRSFKVGKELRERVDAGFQKELQTDNEGGGESKESVPDSTK